MYTSVTIENLRGIRRLVVEGLSRVNLIVGRNNTGKTTVLEGLFLLGGATTPAFPTTLGQLRGQRLGEGSPDALWRPLFWNMDPHVGIKISGQWGGEAQERRLLLEAIRQASYAGPREAEGGEEGIAAITQEFVIGRLSLLYTSASGRQHHTQAVYEAGRRGINAPSEDRDDFVRTTFLSARSYPPLARDAQQYSLLVRRKQERDILEALQIIEPRIERIEVLSEPGGPSVYADIGLDSLIPLAACGEGFVRLFSIAVELAASRGGVLLIDEIDNGLHYSVMDDLWAVLHTLCAKHDVQVVATTHNEEMIRSAFAAFDGQLADLGLFRIDRRGDEHEAVRYDEEDMRAVRREHFEVRG
ncbi:MAG: ATP-binding protein [Gemmataceae bacterium]|nr:ATP-binding protein [Gemmataceae bacterium]